VAQAALSDVFAALSGATGLKHLNLYGDQGVSGPMQSAMAATFGSGVCSLARSSLRTLQLMGVNGSGSLPPCLLGTGSRLVELNLGAPDIRGDTHVLAALRFTESAVYADSDVLTSVGSGVCRPACWADGAAW
jgi:hypothetical protein